MKPDTRGSRGTGWTWNARLSLQAPMSVELAAAARARPAAVQKLPPARGHAEPGQRLLAIRAVALRPEDRQQDHDQSAGTSNQQGGHELPRRQRYGPIRPSVIESPYHRLPEMKARTGDRCDGQKSIAWQVA